MKKNQKQPISFLDLPYDCIGEIVLYFKRCKDINNFKLVKKEFYNLLKNRKFLHKNVLYKFYSSPHINFNCEQIYKISIEESCDKKIISSFAPFLPKFINMKVLKFKRIKYLNISEIFKNLPEKIINGLETIDLTYYVMINDNVTVDLDEDEKINKFKNLKTFIIENFDKYPDNCYEIDIRTCEIISNIKKLKVNNFYLGRENFRNFSNLVELSLQNITFNNIEDLTFSIFIKNLRKLKLIETYVNNNFFQNFSNLIELYLIDTSMNLTDEMFTYEGVQNLKKLVITCKKFTSNIFTYLKNLEEFSNDITVCKKCRKKIRNVLKESYSCHICDYLFCHDCFIEAYKKREINFMEFNKLCCDFTCYKCSRIMDDCSSCFEKKREKKRKVCVDKFSEFCKYVGSCSNDVCDTWKICKDCEEESVYCSSKDCDILVKEKNGECWCCILKNKGVFNNGELFCIDCIENIDHKEK